MRDVCGSNVNLLAESDDSELLDNDIDEPLQDITFDDIVEEIGHHDILRLYHHQHIMDQLYQEAFQKYSRCANDSKDSHSHYLLAHFYFNGYGVQRDYNLAFHHYQIAMEQNHPGALFYICMLYGTEADQSPQFIHTQTPENLAKFKVSMYVKSGAQGQYTNAYAELVDFCQKSQLWQSALNELYEQNLQSVNGTLKESDNYHEIADLYNQLGFICMVKCTINNYDDNTLYQAGEFFQKAAQLGNASAYFNLGFFKYGFSFSPDKDKEKQIQMFEMAATNGHTLAQYQLGYHWLSTSRNQVESCKKSYNYFLQSSTHGYSDILFNIGFMYINGIGGVQQNIQLAIDYFRSASVIDDLACSQYVKRECSTLGFIYERGIGVPIDLMLASHFYAYGATFQLNNERSHCRLAKLIEKEHITPSSIGDAIELYLRSMASNDQYICGYANYRLGKIYNNPRYNEYFDEDKANYHYQVALSCFQSYHERLGEERADHYYHLAKLYENGFGVDINIDMALNYYRLSIKTSEDTLEIYQNYFGHKAKSLYDSIIANKDK